MNLGVDNAGSGNENSFIEWVECVGGHAGAREFGDVIGEGEM